MVARAAIVTLLANDAEINSLGLTVNDIYGPNSVDSPDRDRMFIVIRVDDEPKAFVGKSIYIVSLWAHSPKSLGSDMTSVDALLVRIQEVLEAAEHVAGADGWTLTSASWQGSSGDFVDDGYHTNTRYSTYRLACRNVVAP